LPFDSEAKTVTLPDSFTRGPWRVAVIELDTAPVAH
jgi:hypothetical protein